VIESSPLSDFIRNASHERKREVYEHVMREVLKSQAQVMSDSVALMARRKHERRM
jgi:hypothetical protein